MKGFTLFNANAQTKEIGWTLSTRLRGSLPSEHLYPLVYLARFAQKTGRCDDHVEMIELASQGDGDIAALLNHAYERLSADGSFDELLAAISNFSGETIDTYLQNGPISQGIFGVESSTPEGIARLALAVLDIKPDEKIIDFGCGTGNFLEAAAAKCPGAKLVGVELNPSILAIAKLRSKVTSSKICYACDDMFRYFDSNIEHSPVDKAFSNYPWGMQTKMFSKSSNYIEKVMKGQERYSRPSSSDWVFNRLLVDSLKKDGAAAAVMSNGACFNGMDKPVREYFVKNGFIKAIVALPKGVFAPYTMIQTSFVILSAGGSKGVRFVDATDLGTNDRRSCSIDETAINAIVERLGTDSEKSVFKTLDEIAARDFDLSAKRYLEIEIEIPNGVGLGSVAKIMRGASVRAAELDALVCDEDTGLSYLNLGNISDGSIDDDLPNLSTLDMKLEKYRIHDGDVLISKSGAPFKVAVAEVPEDRKIIANGNLYVLSTNREKIDPYYLAAFFSSPTGKELLAREAVGTTIPSVPIKALSNIKVPLEDADRQKTIADAYLAKTDEIKLLKLRLSRARQELTDLFDEEG